MTRLRVAPRRLAWLGTIAVLTALAAPQARASVTPAHPHFHSADGLHVTAIKRVDPREFSVTVLSPALGQPAQVRILLPTAYNSDRQQHFPTLYLYTGTGGHAADWTDLGKVEQLTAGLPLIVVMPDVGFGPDGGWFSNWRDTHTSLGPNQWETFEVRQLIPWVDANLRTRATRGSRAIAGLSQGGFGSMVAAARHPDLFVSAAAFSGAVDIAYGNTVSPLGHAFVTATTAGDGVNPFAIFGSPITDEINWEAHDPTTLVRNLRGMDVRLYTGNGLPGPLDTPTSDAAGSVEVLAHTLTLELSKHARQSHVSMHLVDYGPGTHSWPYWTRDLTWYLPELMHDFAASHRRPKAVYFQSAGRRWSQWGWSVAIHRAVAQQFSYLTAARSTGFRLAGSGSAVVRTPRLYPSRTSIPVTVTSAKRAVRRHILSDPAGRLTIRLSLPGAVTIAAPAPQGAARAA